MNNYKKSYPVKHGCRAFTVIELLVAVGVTALLVSLMLTIVVNVMGGWSKSSGSLTSGNQARNVLDMLTADLQGAILRRDGNVWLAATIQASPSGGQWSGSKKPSTASSLDPNTNPTSSLYIPAITANRTIDDYRFGLGGVWLRFFTNVADTNTAGDLTKISAPRAVSYQIVRNLVVAGGTEKRYLFYRSELAPNTTFTTGYNLFDTAYYTGAGAVIRTPAADSVIATNVVDFGVRFYNRSSTNASVLIFPDTGNFSFGATSDTTKSGSGVDNSPVRDFPTDVEIYVRVLTDEGATKLANLEDGLNSTETWWDIVQANSRVYTRRIEIKSKGI